MTMHERNIPFRRIAVIGSSGAGKSTLSVVLGARTGLPVVHLDKEHWQPGWTETDRHLWNARLAELAAAPEWIIDGQYGASLRVRLERADLAIFLDLPTSLCLWRVGRRILGGYGRVRPDMGDGCPEQFSLEFLHFVATFRRLQRPKVVAALNESRPKTVWLRSRSEQAAFGATLCEHGLDTAVAAAPLWPQSSGFSSTTM
ncbi:MAG TPA: topology modulation protein [Sphingomonas sp.]